MATFTVTTGADTTDANDGQLSLREALALAADTTEADRIVFETSVQRVGLESFLQVVEGSDVTIDGDTDGNGFFDVTIDGGGSTGLFGIAEGGALALEGLRLTGGANSGNNGGPGAPGTGGDGGDGTDGAIIFNSGALSLERVLVDASSVTGGGAGSGGSGARGSNGRDGSDGADARLAGAFSGFPATPGANGRDAFSGGRGGDGGDAGDAGVIVNGGDLTLRDVGFGEGISVVAANGGRGGNGGAGGTGGDGGDGGNGLFVAFGQDGFRNEDGGDSGDGGPGGSGGDGGDGGDAALVLNEGTVTASTPIAVVDEEVNVDAGARGGAGSGGAGGSAGSPGAGGDAGAVIGGNGDAGARGANGGSGQNGRVGADGEASPGLLNQGEGTGEDFETVDTLFFAHAEAEQVDEGEELRFTVSRLGSRGNVNVDYMIAGLTAADLASGSLMGTVSFTAGDADVQTVSLMLADDETTEASETATFSLSAPSFTSASDDTAALGTDSVETIVNDTSVAEGDAPGAVATDGTDGDDVLRGTDGPDMVEARGGADDVATGDGDDGIDGGSGEDSLVSGDGDDTVDGGTGDDTIKSGDGNDEIDGGDGNDVILGGNGDDLIIGGPGDDNIKPGRGNDTVIGGDGDDVVAGFRGDERFEGGEGNDRLLGSVDDDTLIGGSGDDRLWGGPGFDVFVFEQLDFGDDTLPLDVRVGSDVLDFTAIDGLTRADFTITQVGSNVVLEVDGGGSLVMNGVRFGGLFAEDIEANFDEFILL